MDKNAVLGELLYIVSSFEKGRIRSSGFWKKEYVNSLKESLKIMELLLSLQYNTGSLQIFLSQGLHL